MSSETIGLRPGLQRRDPAAELVGTKVLALERRLQRLERPSRRVDPLAEVLLEMPTDRTSSRTLWTSSRTLWTSSRTMRLRTASSMGQSYRS
jgi:hypothetical protein